LLSNMKARVFMDGKEIGQTPMMEYRVCAGNHEFVFQSIEDKPQERIVEENIKPFGSKRIEQTF